MDFDAVSNLYNAYKAKKINPKIHPNDVMHHGGEAFYDSVGLSGVRAVLAAASLSWQHTIKRVMDLPCGHGRVSRHLRALFPDAEMFYCDIDAEGADFCAETFNGKAIHSQPDLLKVKLPEALDVIWVGSLFTHIDKSRTELWLRYLADHLNDHGVVVATFHGYFSEKYLQFHHNVDPVKVRNDFEKTGYGYLPYQKAGELEDYGLSLSKPSAIMDIVNAIPGVRAAYIERGWANNHDVLVIIKNDRLATF